MVIVDDTVAGTENPCCNIYSNSKLIGPPKSLLMDITVLLFKKAVTISMNMYIDFDEHILGILENLSKLSYL